MAAAGVGQATRDRARKVLSSAFGWGVETGRLRANGAREYPSQPSPVAPSVGGEASPVGHHEGAERKGVGDLARSVRRAASRRARSANARRPLWMPGARRDRVSMLYGLGLRPQELFGATFRQVSRGRFRVAQVLTKAMGPAGSSKPVGRIIAAAKTADGVRTMAMRAVAARGAARVALVPCRRGLPGGRRRLHHPGSRTRRPLHARAAAQLHPRHQGVRARRRARDPDLSFLMKVTPYSLRRGHISLRVLAGEDIKRIADDCGTSTAMIHRHYLYELDMRHELPDDFSFDGRSRPPGAACVTCAWRDRCRARRGRRVGRPPERRVSPRTAPGYTGLRMDPLFGWLLAGWHSTRGGQKFTATCIRPVWATRKPSLRPRVRYEFAGLLPS